MVKCLHILLIDDSIATNVMNQQFINEFDKNIKVNSVLNGLDALDYLENVDIEELPDLILLDLKMPIIDGYEFLNKLKKDNAAVYKKIKVVLLTHSVNPDNKKKMEKFDCVINYLLKPLSYRQINYMLTTLN